MPQSYTGPVRVYKYPFELVMKAYEKRFPVCPQIPIFIASEIVSEYHSDDGAVEIIERRCTLKFDAPRLLKKVAGVDSLLFIQKNHLNLLNRTLNIDAWNESFSSRIDVKEHCKYSVHPDNPAWTIFEQSAVLEIKSFFGFEATIEKLGAKQYAANLKKGKEIMQEFIDQLAEEGITYVPPFCERGLPSNQNPSTSDSRAYTARPRTASTSSSDDGMFSTPPELDTRLCEDYIKSYLGVLSPLQESRLVELRQRISELHKDKLPSDREILRFLRARDFNFDKAREMLCASLAWRKQHHVDHILSTWKPPQVLLDYYSGGWHHFDNENRPVYILRLGSIDVKGIMKAVGEESIVRYVLSIMEDGLRRTETATQKLSKPISSWTCILDLDDLSLRHLWKPGIKALVNIIGIVESNYPETMGRMLIVRAPRIFPILWTLVSPFIDERTCSKFVFCDSPSVLSQYIPAENIPEFLDGPSKCDIASGTLVPKRLYRMEVFDDGSQLCGDTVYKTISVVAGQPYEILIPINESDSVITWDFDVKRGDVRFSVFRGHDLPSSQQVSQSVSPSLPRQAINSQSTTTVVQMEKLDSEFTLIEGPLICKDGSSIQGSHVCKKAGSFVLQWKYHCAPKRYTDERVREKSKFMYYTDVLNATDYKGSMNSLQSIGSTQSAHSEHLHPRIDNSLP